MDDLRSRFAALDRLPVPDLSDEVQRRIGRLAERPVAVGIRPRVGWAGGRDRRHGVPSGRRLAPMPGVLLVVLLVGVLLASVSLAAGWWQRRSVLVPPSTEQPRALVPTGECPGAVELAGDAPPFRGWLLGPEPGFLASRDPGRITALWREARPGPIPPGETENTRLVLVEVDPIARTMCRLFTPVRYEGANLLEGGSLPAGGIAWTPRGDALVLFRGGHDDDHPDQLGPLTVWWPGSRAEVASFQGDFGNAVWSNTGSLLAVTRAAAVTDWALAKHQAISVYPADGTEPRDIRFSCDPCLNYAAGFSPDDTRLAIRLWRVNAAKTDADELVAVADLATGDATVIDIGLPDLEVIGWREDRTILAVDGGRRLVAIPVADPLRFTLVAEFPIQLGTDAVYQTFSPDFSKVAYLQMIDGGRGDEWDVFVLDIGSGSARRLAREAGPPPVVVWAPDSRTLAYASDIDAEDSSLGVTLKVADAMEGAPVSIANYLTPVAWRPAWR
jgi:hypothetical protein